MANPLMGNIFQQVGAEVQAQVEPAKAFASELQRIPDEERNLYGPIGIINIVIGQSNKSPAVRNALNHLKIVDNDSLVQSISLLEEFQTTIIDPDQKRELTTLTEQLKQFESAPGTIDKAEAASKLYQMQQELHETHQALLTQIYDQGSNSLRPDALVNLSLRKGVDGSWDSSKFEDFEPTLDEIERRIIQLSTNIADATSAVSTNLSSSGQRALSQYLDQQLKATGDLRADFSAMKALLKINYADLIQEVKHINTSMDDILSHFQESMTKDIHNDPLSVFTSIGIDIVPGKIKSQANDDKVSAYEFEGDVDIPKIRNEISELQKKLDQLLPSETGEKKTQLLLLKERVTQASNIINAPNADAQINKMLQLFAKSIDMPAARAKRFAHSCKLECPDMDEATRLLSGKSGKELKNLTGREKEVYEAFLTFWKNKTFFDLYGILGTSYYKNVSLDDIQNTYKQQMSLYNNPSVKKALGDDADLIINTLGIARDTLINIHTKGTYDKKEIEDRAALERLGFDLEAKAMLDKMENFRSNKRKEQSLENANPKGKIFGDINWSEFLRSPTGQLGLMSAHYGSLLTEPVPLLVIGAAVYGIGTIAAAPFVIAAVPWIFAACAASSILQTKAEVSFNKNIENGIISIYGRIVQYYDIPYTTRIQADYRGYLKLNARVDHLEETMIQYMLDYREELGEDYVALLTKELIRTKREIRFDMQFSFEKENDDGDAEVVKQVRQIIDEKSYSKKRMSLLLGEIFPPESVLPSDKLNEFEKQAITNEKRMSDSEWNALVLDDPGFEKIFSSKDSSGNTIINNRMLAKIIQKPSDLFNPKKDAKKLGFYTLVPKAYWPIYQKYKEEKEQSDAHSIKVDIRNIYEVIELGHGLVNALNYQLGVMAMSSANKQMDQNIQGTGIYAANGQPGFAQRIAKKRHPYENWLMGEKEGGKKK
jgi:hypothetical protein